MKDFVDFIIENYENIFEKLDLGQKSGNSSEADIDLHKLEHIFKTFREMSNKINGISGGEKTLETNGSQSGSPAIPLNLLES